MNFLKTLFWVLLAVLVYAFSSSNWFDVTLTLWSDLRADVKLPLLLLVAALIGFLPTFLVLRSRMWSLQRRLEAHERNSAPPTISSRPAPGPTESSAE